MENSLWEKRIAFTHSSQKEEKEKNEAITILTFVLQMNITLMQPYKTMHNKIEHEL